jgi:tellurite resistance protein TerC
MTHWFLFHLLIAGLLLLDLGLWRRLKRGPTLREAALWSIFWVGISLLFNLYIGFHFGWEKGLAFLTGYLVEKSLSVDNLFIFLVIFSYFKMTNRNAHRILYLGVIGAFVLRLGLILAGISLIENFVWLIQLLGTLLIITGVRLAMQRETSFQPGKSWWLQKIQKIIPFTHKSYGEEFLVRERGAWKWTPMFLVLLAVEGTDLIFALDSIPAIFAITTDPFIAYTSNVFAVLGLRSLYFVMTPFLHRFVHLKIGLGAILVFIGVKMVVSELYELPLGFSLLGVGMILGVTLLCSLRERGVSGR